MSPAKTTNIPCCMVLTRQKLLMCHEDTETNFVRTLGSANLIDVLIYFVVDESSKDHQYTMLYGSDKTKTIDVA